MSLLNTVENPVRATGSRSQASLTAIAAQMPSVDLDQLSQIASLQTRVDTKYLLTPEQMVAVLNQTGAHLRVLEIDGKRSFGYESVYFDTRHCAHFAIIGRGGGCGLRFARGCIGIRVSACSRLRRKRRAARL